MYTDCQCLIDTLTGIVEEQRRYTSPRAATKCGGLLPSEWNQEAYLLQSGLGVEIIEEGTKGEVLVEGIGDNTTEILEAY